MIQRVLIALALGCQPKLIIADEPTTNLDVTIEAQILKLFLEMQKKVGTSILYISHDLGVISELCERVMVMYAGKIIEIFAIQELLTTAKHPYTKGLIFSNPSIDSDLKKLPQIEGEIPDAANYPSGCSFHPRCNHAIEICKQSEPKMLEIDKGHFVSCHLY
jgi:oligopeptide/dipeptide ABC transporter ATP-binding protein